MNLIKYVITQIAAYSHINDMHPETTKRCLPDNDDFFVFLLCEMFPV